MKTKSQPYYRICDKEGNILEEDYLRVHADSTGIRRLVKSIMEKTPNAHYAEYRMRGGSKLWTIANF